MVFNLPIKSRISVLFIGSAITFYGQMILSNKGYIFASIPKVYSARKGERAMCLLLRAFITSSYSHKVDIIEGTLVNSILEMAGRNAFIALLLDEFTEDVIVDQNGHNNWA